MYFTQFTQNESMEEGSIGGVVFWPFDGVLWLCSISYLQSLYSFYQSDSLTTKCSDQISAECMEERKHENDENENENENETEKSEENLLVAKDEGLWGNSAVFDLFWYRDSCLLVDFPPQLNSKTLSEMTSHVAEMESSQSPKDSPSSPSVSSISPSQILQLTPFQLIY
jgi:hypothetical protein